MAHQSARTAGTVGGQSKFSQVYMRLHPQQQAAFREWLKGQPGQAHTLPLMAAWHSDPATFRQAGHQALGIAANNNTAFNRSLHHLTETLENYLIWNKLQDKKIIKSILLAESYNDLNFEYFKTNKLNFEKFNGHDFIYNFIATLWIVNFEILKNGKITIYTFSKIIESIKMSLFFIATEANSIIANFNFQESPDISRQITDYQALTDWLSAFPENFTDLPEELKMKQYSATLSRSKGKNRDEIIRYYAIWKSQIENNNDPAIYEAKVAFHGNLRNAFARYHNQHPTDTNIMHKLWNLWEIAIKQGYAKTGGRISEKELNSFLRLSQKVAKTKEEVKVVLNDAGLFASQNAIDDMIEIYYLWYTEQYEQISKKLLIDKKLYSNNYYVEYILIQLRSIIFSKEFYRSNHARDFFYTKLNSLKNQIAKISTDQYSASTIRYFEAEWHILDSCRQASDLVAWQAVKEEILRSENFPSRRIYEEFVEKMITELR